MFDRLASQLQSSDSIDRRPALGALAAAGVMGLAGDLLFNGAAAGINAPLWCALLLVALVSIARTSGLVLPLSRLLLLLAALMLMAVLALRASATLQVTNLTGAAALFGLAVALPPGTGLRRIGLLAFVLAIGVAGFAFVAGAMRFLPDSRTMSKLSERFSSEGRWLGRALLIGAPLVLVFGGLFVSADAVFEQRAGALLRIDLSGVLRHGAWILACAWASLGMVWGTLWLKPLPAPEVEVPESRRLRAVEVGLVLGSLAALFGSFVLVQLRYLFAGHDLVERTVGLTYAEYARRGFFELVAVAALLLPVLLVIDWARSSSARSQRVYRLLALALVALLFVVMASAVQRLRIYQATFGLTELRFYSLAFLLLLGGVFFWFLMSVLRGHGHAFWPGVVVLATLAGAVVTVLNPDSVIARVNIERGAQGKTFDAQYLTSLSADSVPAIVANFDSIPLAERCSVARGLVARWVRREYSWRDWNLGRSRARTIVEAERARLEASCEL